MARKRSAEKESQWQDLVDRQAESGLSVRAFCEQEGVSEKSLYFWRRELPRRKRRKRQFARGKSSTTTAIDFIPVPGEWPRQQAWSWYTHWDIRSVSTPAESIRSCYGNSSTSWNSEVKHDRQALPHRFACSFIDTPRIFAKASTDR